MHTCMNACMHACMSPNIFQLCSSGCNGPMNTGWGTNGTLERDILSLVTLAHSQHAYTHTHTHMQGGSKRRGRTLGSKRTTLSIVLFVNKHKQFRETQAIREGGTREETGATEQCCRALSLAEARIRLGKFN